MALFHFDPSVAQALGLLLVVVAADTTIGILRSLVKGGFHLSLVGNFLTSAVLPFNLSIEASLAPTMVLSWCRAGGPARGPPILVSPMP